MGTGLQTINSHDYITKVFVNEAKSKLTTLSEPISSKGLFSIEFFAKYTAGELRHTLPVTMWVPADKVTFG